MSAFDTDFSVAYDSTLVDEPTEIPPPILSIGTIEGRRNDIIERVAKNINSHSDDEWVASAVDAAIIFVIDKTGRSEIGLPDDPVTVNGLVIFSQRLYLDTPNGAQVAVADDSFGPIFQPESLWKHVRHYFDRLDISWGIA